MELRINTVSIVGFSGSAVALSDEAAAVNYLLSQLYRAV